MESRSFVASDIVPAMTTQPKRPPGRPRKWDSEAERTRAYRARKAAELADPLAQREAAKTAAAEAVQAKEAAGAGRADAERWRRRAERANADVARARHQAAQARERAQQAIAERDEARRLLTRKLQNARHAAAIPAVRDNPNELLAIIAELYPELDRVRQENKKLRTRLRLPPAEVEYARQRAWRHHR